MSISTEDRSLPLADDPDSYLLDDLNLNDGTPVLDCAATVVYDAVSGRASSATDQVGAAYAMGTIAHALGTHAGNEDLWVVTPIAETVIGLMGTLSGMAATMSRLADAAERQPHLFARPSRRFGEGPRRSNQDGPLTSEEAVEEAQDFASKLRGIGSALLLTRRAYDQLRVTNYGADPGWMLAAAIKAGTAVDLYRRFDDQGNLLYVGISNSMEARQAAHAKKSSWSAFATTGTVERFATRDEAERAERAAIENERPLFNSQHNDTPEARQRLVAYLVERGRLDLLAPAVSRG